MPKVISIHSFRGGTGKSNFTANLATIVACQGYKVAVADIDLPSPGIHNLFCLESQQINYTLNNYLWGECSIEETVYDVSHNLGRGNECKLYLIPSSVMADDIARILQDSYDVSLMNDGFRRIVKALELDFLFIDTHPGLSKETFLSIAVSHILILILRPDKQDYQGAAVTLDVARQLKVRKILLAINKVHSKLNRDALKQKVEATYAEKVAGIFPLSEDMAKLASEGVFYSLYPEHPISQEFIKVAQQIIGS